MEHSLRRFKFSKRWLLLKIALVSFILVVLIGSETLYLLAEQTVKVCQGGIYPEDSIIIDNITPQEFVNATQNKIFGMEDFTPIEQMVNLSYTLEYNGFRIPPHATILGVEPQYFSLFSIKIGSGRAIEKNGEMVMGSYIFKYIKGSIPRFHIGSEIKIKNLRDNLTLTLKVVGVMKQQKPNSAQSLDYEESTLDTTIFISLHDYRHIFGNSTEPALLIKPRPNKGLLVYYQLKSKFDNVEYLGIIKFRNTVALSWLKYFLIILNFSTILSVATAIFAAAVSQIKHSETEFGVLKSSGVSPAKIFIILFLESFYVLCVALIISFLLGGVFLFSLLSLSNLGLSLQEIFLYTIGFPILIIFLPLLIYPVYGVIYYQHVTAVRLLRVT